MNSPYKGKFRISQQYKGILHDGLDLVGIENKNIYSTVNGIVEVAGWENAADHKQGFGLYVRIKQDGGIDKYYYGHLSQIAVKVGNRVKIGDLLGIEGSTGKSTGSHCHYCVRAGGLKSQIKDICEISGIPNVLGGIFTSDENNAYSVDVVYRVKVSGRWLGEVKNTEDFAGICGKAITDIAVRTTSGSVKYRVHTYKGVWLPYVSGYDITDYKNGYAGNGKPVDAVEIVYTGENGNAAEYRVSPLNKNYYSWQKNNVTANGQDGYAGLFGRKIDRLQILIK